MAGRGAAAAEEVVNSRQGWARPNQIEARSEVHSLTAQRGSCRVHLEMRSEWLQVFNS